MGSADDEEMSKLAIASFQAREQEIERKKMEVKGRVESQLSRAEEETKRLAQIWEVCTQTPNTSVIIYIVDFSVIKTN